MYAHTVAVVEKADCLAKCLNWLQKSGKDCNIGKLVTTGNPQERS